MTPPDPLYARPESSKDSNAPGVPFSVVQGCWADGPGVRAKDDPTGVLARDLPETALRTTSRRPIPQPSTASLTCAVMWPREVLRGVVNQRRIDGKDGIAAPTESSVRLRLLERP
jgi:hypothetical protein